MSTLLEKSIRINRIVTTTPNQAKAIEDPARAKILEILYRKTLSAEQIANSLNKHGYKKALTTIRHHIDILKEAGLIEIVKIEEKRGAITKFYGTSTKLLRYTTPDDFDTKYSSVIKNASKKLEDVLQNLTPKTTSKKRHKKQDQGYSQYIMMEILNRAVTLLMETSDQNRIKKHQEKPK